MFSQDKFSEKNVEVMNKDNTQNLYKTFLSIGKMAVVYLIIFQIFIQPIAVFSQNRGVLQTTNSRKSIQTEPKSNIKPKVEDSYDEVLPNFENKVRKTYSDAFGSEIPLPQVFGENGKLSSLLSGSFFGKEKNQELIDLALNREKEPKSNSNKTKIEQPVSETAVSLNAPILKSGLIDGSLRVAKEVPFSLDNNFRLSQNLYTVGSPDFQTNQDSQITNIVNEESDDLAKNYDVFLNGGKIDANLFIHSVAENLFTDIPTSLPKAIGTENLEINSEADLKNVKDWAKIRNITVNLANKDVLIPVGNYESLTLNVPSRIVFEAGNYNFSDTINFQKGSSLEIKGKTNIGIGKNLTLDQATIKTSPNISAKDVKINVLGSSVILSEKSQITASLRATNANVVLNENTKVTGQVIAGSLVMNGGIITETNTNNLFNFLTTYDDNIAIVKEGLTVSGRIEGSVQQLLGQNTVINGNAAITGDLLVPGVPQLVQNGNMNFGGVVTGTGSATPTNYQVVLNGNSTLRKLKNRINPISVASIPTPPTNWGTQTVNINNSSQYPTNFTTIKDLTMNGGSGTLTIPPGTYRNITVNGNSGIRLGVAGQSNPVTYNLNNLIVNGNSQIQILSPVILNLASGITLSSSIGVLNNPEWLRLNVTTGNVVLNGNVSLYGGVVAPDSTVTINGNSYLIGNVVCKKLVVNGNGVLRNVLPNLISETTAPVLTITSPQNNSTTTDSAITIQGTATDNVGISQVLVNNTQANYNSSNNTWSLANFPLVLGANQITVKAVDTSGNQTTQTITVTRNPVVVDTTPPVLLITSPTNNSTTQAQTITVTGTATDNEANASGLASVLVNGQAVTLSANGNWTISNVALNVGANTITAKATDNAGNITTKTITITRNVPDTTPPTLTISTPANNSETNEATINISGTVSDTGGTTPSGVASVNVNGQPATVNGNSWTISNVALSVGTNVIIANAIDNAGNSSSQQVTVTRITPDTTAPTITVTSPTNNFETNETTVSISGTAVDSGTNASGVVSVTINGQNVTLTGENWSINNLNLNIGTNTFTIKATDQAGNEATSTLTVVRREPDVTAPIITISSPQNNFETLVENVTVEGTVVDNGTNASGVQSVVVNGLNATINGNVWSVQNVPLTIGSNTITAVAKDNNNNTSNISIVVIRNPIDTTPPNIAITSPINNFETFDSQVIISGTVTDTGAGATGVQSVTVNGVNAAVNLGANTWSATVNLVDGVNQITATAVDNAPTPNQSQANIQVRKTPIQPPILNITSPQNGAFLSSDSITVAGNVSSNKPDMTFSVSVNGSPANLAGREFTKTFNLVDGTNIITVIATDALGQQVQESRTVINDRTPPTISLINVPQVVSPGESYTIGAFAADTNGVADVEFTVDGVSIVRSSVSPYQFTLNVPLNQAPNVNLNISAIARDNAGLSATATARITTTGPSGLTGYVFDDATGYILPNANAKLNNSSPILTDENGLYSFVSSNANGNILISKQGYTTIERNYSASAGAGVEVFDARLTPIDSKVNTADVNGSVNASDSANKIQVQFAPNSFANGSDVRLTSISPQGLANLLPFGWSPIPDAVVDIRTANETEFSNRNFANAATLTIPQVTGLSSNIPIVLARYNSSTHNWVVLQKDIFAGANGELQASISTSGQYAFLAADTGATAPPNAVVGQNLPASASANSEQLDSATASASSNPTSALFSNTAKARINFVANSTSKLPSGVAIEASFEDSYIPLIDRNTIIVDRPSQDFVLYSFPSVSTNEPNKLGAYFVAKPIRTDFAITDLLNAKVHVDIRSGRLSQSGVLIGQTGGTVRGSEGSELEIPTGSVSNSQTVFFRKIPNNQTGIILPSGYETIGAFDVNLSGATLTQSAKISMPTISGDNSKIVVAKVISIGGQQGLKIVGRVTEQNSRLVSTNTSPLVPTGVNLVGVKDSGKYLFVRMPSEFGFIKGNISSSVANTQAIKVTNTQTPFVDLTANNGNYVVLGLANGENNQVDAISLSNDATGFATTSIFTQDAVNNLPISLASSVLSVQTVTPTNGATNVIVTTPITITFNKPVSNSTVTGSNIKLVTASGNPVLTTITMLAGGRSVVLTPSTTLQSETNYKVQVSANVKDIYGNTLPTAFESTFTTANLVTASNQLQPSQIRIAYPNEQGLSTISIPAGAIQAGSIVFAINNSTGATVSTVVGSNGLEIQIQARIGDEIELIIQNPNGTEYRVKQAAYRRADGFVSVGSNGGTITSEDGTLVLQVPAGAISGQADVKMTFAPESSITTPREGEMAPSEMSYIGGVKFEVQGNFTENEELHLELPAPANVQEGQRALIMKPSKINYNGSEIDSWETITSAKVEGGKIKSTSPPFIGISLGAIIVTGVLPLFYYVFIPQRQKVVTGLVRKQKQDGTYELVKTGQCYVPRQQYPPVMIGEIQNNGRFTMSYNLNIPLDVEINVVCESSGEIQGAIAYTSNSTEPGVSGFEVRYANVIYPASSLVNEPPQIYIEGVTLDSSGQAIAPESDPLKQFGKVQAGANIRINSKVLGPPSTNIISQELLGNGQPQAITNQCVNFDCFTLVSPSIPGRYSFTVKARSSLNNPATETTKTFNFVVLENPNVQPPLPGVNPSVISVSPSDSSSQIDVGTSIHIEFSEPVKNLSGASTGGTIYLEEDEIAGEKVYGKIYSGGILVNLTDAKSVIDFVPNKRLKSGKTYKVVVTTDVIDTNEGNPNVQPPIPPDPIEKRKLDQSETESGLQEFTSKFRTFQGGIITPTPINAQGYKIAMLDDMVITTTPVINGVGSTGVLKVYDSNDFIGATDPQNLQPVNSLFIPHIPINLAAKKEIYTINGQNKELNLIAVTTTTIDNEYIKRPRNVWFYSLDENNQLDLVGVVSLVANGDSGRFPNSISVERKRAYIGSSSNGGVYVVDIQQAIDSFKDADNTPNDGNPYNNTAVTKAVASSTTPQGGGFGLEAIMQRANYMTDSDYFPVVNVSTITQGLNPFTYVTSYQQKLISFGLSQQFDGVNGYLSGGENGKDRRVVADYASTPILGFNDIKAVQGIQLQGESKDIAVGVNSHLMIFDVTNPIKPKQYPIKPENSNQPQLPAKSFAELGVPIEIGTYGKQVEIEGTLAYVMFDNGIAVFDISNPAEPYMTTSIAGLIGLRRFIVKDGFIYTLGSNGLNVSIGRAVAQIRTYGFDPNSPDDVCGNPVVINKETNKPEQPVGVFFQLYGHNAPSKAKAIFRKVTVSDQNRVETVLKEVNIPNTNLRSITTSNGSTIINGSIQWDGKDKDDTLVTIERESTYTVEIVIDDDFHSKQTDIPFSNLIPEQLFQKTIVVRDFPTSQDPQHLDTENVGSFNYLVAGNVIDVDFKIDNHPIDIYTSPYKDQINSSQPRPREIKPNTRPFGSITDYIVPESLQTGLYPFTYKAKLKANPNYFEEVSGVVKVGDINGDVRQPGSTVVSGVEVNSGNLAISENDISIKGRGLSLDLTRSYNSQQADNFSTFGYGWTHSYNVSLVHYAGGYTLIGGEGSGQQFKDFQTNSSGLPTNILKADKPYLGTLVKNADGSLDYFTKSQTKYHFRQPVENGSPNQYLGNLDYIEEPNKNQIRFTYDSNLRLSKVTDSSGRSLNFEYEVADNVFTGIDVGDAIQGLVGCPKLSQFRQITRNLEQSVNGKAWRIKKVKGSDNVGGFTIEYLYDENNNLISSVRSGSDSISESSASKVWKYTYNPTADSNGNNGNAKYDHLLKTFKSPNNDESIVTEYKYLLTQTAPPRVTDILMPEGVKNNFLYEYDANTNLVNKVTFKDGNLNPTYYELTNGRVHTITAPNNATTKLEWTEFGQIKKTTDPENKETEIIFDANNNPSTQKITGTKNGTTESIETITTFDSKFSKMSSFKDGNGNLTSYAINPDTGNVDKITLPNDREVLFNYFPNGDLKDVTDQYGTKTEFTNYDSFGNPQTITKYLGNDQTQIITQTFDARSRQTSKNDSLGTNVTYKYDALDRQVEQKIDDPTNYRDDLTIETTYKPEGQPEQIIQRDGEGELGELNRTYNEYDKLQRLVTTKEKVRGYAVNNEGWSFIREFTYDNNSNILTEQNRRGITTTKTYNALNQLTKIQQGDKTIWEATEIDKVGNPIQVKDLYGNITKYVYDGLQRLREKQLPENKTEKLEYDNNNNITKSFDRNNIPTKYEYDKLNRVAKTISAFETPENRTTIWTYIDATHEVKKEIVNRGLVETTLLDGLERPLSQKVSATGINYETTYTYNGRNVTVKDPRQTETLQKLAGTGEVGEMEVIGANPVYKTSMKYSALGGVSRITDALGRVTDCINDGFNRKTSVTINGGSGQESFNETWKYDGEGLVTEHKDKRNVVSTISYDVLGRKLKIIVKETVPSIKDITVEDISYLDSANKEEIKDARQFLNNALGKTVIEYDGLRRVKEVTNAEQSKKSYSYDGENLLEEGDFKGNITTYKYDKLNRVTHVYTPQVGDASNFTHIEYTNGDLTKTVTDRRGNTTVENYDALGRTLNVTQGNLPLVSYTYDGGSNRLTQTDGEGHTTNFTYDKLSRLTEIKHPNNLQTEIITYDAVGNVLTHDDGRGSVTESRSYNALNQAKEVAVNDGQQELVTKFDFDGGGLMKSKTNPNGAAYKTEYKYNAFGSLTEVTEPEQSPWTFTYDDTQNLVKTKDPLDREIIYEYDALNRLAKTIQPKPSPSDTNRITEYKYDKNSNIREITDPKGQVTTLNYDALDRLDTSDYRDNLNSIKLHHKYYYDAEDNIFQIDEIRNAASRTYTREYDARNRLTKTTDAYGKAVNFSYDSANNLIELTSANKTTNYTYDAKNQLNEVKQNGSTIAKYKWFDDGLLERVDYLQNSTSRVYSYDNADRVKTITNNFNGTNSESFEYEYDKNSNRTKEIKKSNTQTFRTNDYEYDKLDRLTMANYTSNLIAPNPPLNQQANYEERKDLNEYQYDAVGNRINEKVKTQITPVTLTTDSAGNTSRTNGTPTVSDEITTTATYDNLNQLTQLNDTSGISNFEYDKNGNLSKITKTISGTTNTLNEYEYDVRNQLTSAKDGNSNILATFDYDFERKRISKTTANIRTDYAYAGNQVISEFTNNTNSANYTIGGGEVIKSEFVASGENNFHYTDALGSVTSIVNTTNGSLTRNEYNAWGEQLNPQLGSTSNSIGYTGQRLDNETGLMALGNGERYYSPSYARFFQQDSVAGSSINPQSMNRFSYVHNNPLKFADPSGHIADENRGSMANAARDYGINKDGETSTWGVFKNAAARTGYDLWDTISFGALSREEENMAAWEKGEITTEQARWNTFKNTAYSAAQVGLMVATAGAGTALSAGAGLATRVAVGAGLGVAEKFGSDLLGMGFGYQKDFSSAGQYAFAGIMGGAFGAASPGKAATALAKESKLTLSTELKLLGQETRELAQTTKRIGKAFGEGFMKPLPKTMNGFIDPIVSPTIYQVGARTINGVKNVVKKINVGDAGHHVPAVRKAQGRSFEVERSDKTRPTLHFKGEDPALDHWKLHNAERDVIGPRQGSFEGTDQELMEAYKTAYKDLNDIKVDVKSPDGTHNLGEDVTPLRAVELIEDWMVKQKIYQKPEKRGK